MNSQLKMSQHFPEQTNITATKINERNSINFNLKDIKNDNNNMNDNNNINNSSDLCDLSKNSSFSSSSSSSCSVSINNFEKKESMLGDSRLDCVKDNDNNN
jgi:hypothetical protein